MPHGWVLAVCLVLLGLTALLWVVAHVLERRRAALPRVVRPVTQDDQQRVRDLVSARRTWRALVLLRRRYRMRLAEARVVIAALRAGAPYPTSWEQQLTSVPPQVRQDVRAHLDQGRRVDGVARLRRDVRIGLLDSLTFVDVIAGAGHTESRSE